MRRIMNALVALGSGLLFGIGLIVSGMTDPAKVIGFLDVAGHWNPALAFVMGGAVLVTLPAFAIARRRDRALDGTLLELPNRRLIDRPLLIGSVMFGLGWGLSGVCPGPALVIATSHAESAQWFFVSMLLGMLLHELWSRLSSRAQ